MWPFKSKIPLVKNVIFENNNDDVTIIHEIGAHKFKKVDVLDSFTTSDFYSGEKPRYLPTKDEVFGLPLMLFFGFLNMLVAIWPVFLFDYEDREKIINGSITGSYNVFLNFSILLVLAIFLALTLSYFLKIFWRFLEFTLKKNKGVRKDILIVSLNNQFLKVRFNESFDHSLKNLVDFGYVNNIDESYLKKDSSRILFIIILLLFSYLLIAPIYNWDKPYIFWQFIEPNHNKEFIINHESTFLYWNYYAEFDLFQPNFIKHNVNPLIAFLDGVNSFTFHIYILFLFIILVGVSILFLCWISIWPILSIYILFKLSPRVSNLFNNEALSYERKSIINGAIIILSIILIVLINISGFYFFTQPEIPILVLYSLLNLITIVNQNSRKYLFTLMGRIFQ